MLKAISLLDDILKKSFLDKGHGIDHSLTVLNHVENALKFENFDSSTELAIKLAALLHDADDHKFFKDTANVEYILDNIDIDSQTKKMVKDMIALVSCSKNRNNPAERYMLFPRWADRLEATGKIGIERAIIYNDYNKRPIITEDTILARTEEELFKIATSERFERYKGTSKSLLDHMYDKVLHLAVKTGNPYFDRLFEERQKDVIDFCLDFSKLQEIIFSIV